MSKPKVLLVDDLEFYRKLGKIYLKNIGCHVFTAKDGKDAVDKVEKDNYDLIFMDLQMPTMDGMDATMEIRKKNKKIKIVGLTAIDSPVDQDDCIDNGMDYVLTKPVSQKDLINVLKKYRIISKSKRVRKIKIKNMPTTPLFEKTCDSFKVINAPVEMDNVIED